MDGAREWRDAAVIRARTIAHGVRLIEFAVAGPTANFMPGSLTTVEVRIGGEKTRRSYICLPAGPGRIRLTVRAAADLSGGAKWMWSLIEGARVRLAVPENPFRSAGSLQIPNAAVDADPSGSAVLPPRLAGAGIRLVCGRRSGRRHETGNIAGHRSMNGGTGQSASVCRAGHSVRRPSMFVIVDNSFGAGTPSPDHHPFQGRI